LQQGIDGSKIAAFYRKHAGLEILGPVEDTSSQKIALPCLPGMQRTGPGGSVNVAVASSWADDKKRQADVLIAIRKSKRKQIVGGCWRSEKRTFNSDTADASRGKRERA
jgi:hypothetical protein